LTARQIFRAALSFQQLEGLSLLPTFRTCHG